MNIQIIKGDDVHEEQTTQLRIDGRFVASVTRFNLDKDQKAKVTTLLKEAYEYGQCVQRHETGLILQKLLKGLPV